MSDLNQDFNTRITVQPKMEDETGSLAATQARIAQAQENIASAIASLAAEQRTANKIAAVQTKSAQIGNSPAVALTVKDQTRLLKEVFYDLADVQEGEE